MVGGPGVGNGAFGGGASWLPPGIAQGGMDGGYGAILGGMGTVDPCDYGGCGGDSGGMGTGQSGGGYPGGYPEIYLPLYQQPQVGQGVQYTNPDTGTGTGTGGYPAINLPLYQEFVGPTPSPWSSGKMGYGMNPYGIDWGNGHYQGPGALDSPDNNFGPGVYGAYSGGGYGFGGGS